MDHVGVAVDDLDAAIAFFVELGMELDGATTPVEGGWISIGSATSAAPTASSTPESGVHRTGSTPAHSVGRQLCRAYAPQPADR
jgi:catechol 2,3-dioxygenase-like lactoylglutathione lyase family enzyme